MKEFTIDYSPLIATLYKKGLNLTKLGEELKISSRTLSKINKKESMSLNTIGRICAFLEVGIQDVVNIQIK